MSLTAPSLRLAFFDYLFEDRQGYLCIAHAPAKKKSPFKQDFFNWPEDREKLSNHIEEIKKGHNVWFSVNLFKRAARKTELALPTRLVWADLDYCAPDKVTPPPQCRIESSPDRYQAFWRLEEVLIPEEAEALSKRVAYAYADQGADKSGWDITQLLRVPFTYNYKYDNGSQVPEVNLIASASPLLPVEVFREITVPTPEEYTESAEPMPNIMDLPDSANVIYAHRVALRRTAFNDLFSLEPADDWSAAMWHLLNICLEVGMTTEETFAVALDSSCNKYERDDRPIAYLWREILKAAQKQNHLKLILNDATPLRIPELFDGSEPPESVIDHYKEWAEDATDAVTEYHELSCSMLLSSLLAGGLKLATSNSKVYPNLWGLILGDSTLTRKTTAMNMAMEFVAEISRDVIVATEGSAEGMLTAVAGRPGKVSVFFKDEVAGFFDSMMRKEYLAGLPETMTKLYDVPEFYTRVLRKETIVITNPVFIFFGGGIRDRTYGLLNDEHILSGFLPRFLIVGGDTDIENIRPTGPLLPDLGNRRNTLRDKFQEMFHVYNAPTHMEIPEANTTIEIIEPVEVTLADDAWKYFQKIEMQLARAAHDSPSKIIAAPTFSRLAWSCLKLAMLLAAARKKPKDGTLKVTLRDLQAAAYFIQKWGVHTIDLIENIGRSANQRLLLRIYEHVCRKPGTPRSELSRYYHLQKKELDLVVDTLLDRGQIRTEKAGNATRIFPARVS